MQATLPESPKIFRLARLLGVGRMEALGYAVRWFCWLDAQCANGATELRPDEVDALVGHAGITDAMCALGWTSVDAEGYVLVQEFDKHNGESAKKRAETQERVAAHRARLRADSACNAPGVTLALPDKNIYNDNNMGDGISGAIYAAPAAPAPTPDVVHNEDFRRWLAALSSAHPSASKSLYLAPDVLRAAKDAFARCPAAATQADLLQAYFRDTRLADHGFYAPRGQRKFFDDLEDVLAHAERWRKWAGWKPQRRKGAGGGRVGAGQAKGEQSEVAMSDEEREAFFRELRSEQV